jgi:hypothetical protein
MQMRILRLVRLIKLLRILRVSKFMEALESRISVNYSVLQMFQHIVLIAVAAHWLSCAMLLFLHVEV